MIGIITFHGSHNHGSMLQAYATQQSLKKIGFQSEIINFRMKSQKEYYALYQTKYGVMRFVRGLFLVPLHSARRKRFNKFEDFLNNCYILSGDEMSDYKDLETVKDKYDIYLSGSDQIWSNHIPEFKGSKIDYTGVYFLDFANENKKRVAYASSIGIGTFEELKEKKNLLDKYSHIATREKRGSDIIEKVTGKKVNTVIDPTLLLNKNDWKKISGEKPIVDGKYIFLYTLQGIRPGKKWAKELKKLSKRLGVKIIAVSPFFPIVSSGITNLINVGPKEFINLIDNAQMVFTDSFHGTAFSINMNKPFYSLTKAGSVDVRKKSLLKNVGLENREINSFDEIDKIGDYVIDYAPVNEKLELLREDSMKYLKEALAEE